MSGIISITPGLLNQIGNAIKQGIETNVLTLKTEVTNASANNDNFGAKKEQRLDTLWSATITNVGNAGFSNLNSTFSASYNRAENGTPERRALDSVLNQNLPQGIESQFLNATSPRVTASNARFFVDGRPWSSAQSDLNSVDRQIKNLVTELVNDLNRKLGTISSFIMSGGGSRETGWRGELATQAFVSRLSYIEKYVIQTLEGVDGRAGNPDAIVAAVRDAYETLLKHLDTASAKGIEVATQSIALANNRTLFDQQTANMIAGLITSADVGQIPPTQVALIIHIAELLADGRGVQGAFEDQLEDRYQELYTNLTQKIFEVADFFANPGGRGVPAICADIKARINQYNDLIGQTVEAEIRIEETSEHFCSTTGETLTSKNLVWQQRTGIGSLSGFISRGFTENITAVLPIVSTWENTFETTQNRARNLVDGINIDEHVRRLKDRCADAIYSNAEFESVLRVMQLANNHLDTQGRIFHNYSVRLVQTMRGAATNGLAHEIRQGENYYKAVLETVERDFCFGASVRTVESQTASGGSLTRSIMNKVRDATFENTLGFIASNGRSLAAHLQPRNSLGQFVQNKNSVTRFIGRNLRNGNIGRVATRAKKSLPFVGGVIEGINYYRSTGNVGRAISYGGLFTIAGGVGKLATAGIAAVFAVKTAPVWLVVGIGLAVVYGARALYNNVPFVQNTVHHVGDAINAGIDNVRNTIRNGGNNHTNTMGFEWV